MKILNRRGTLYGTALVLFLSTTGFVHDCGGNGAPVPAGCENPATGMFGLDVGTEDMSAFVPLADGGPVTVIQGGQGSSMFPIRVELTGAGEAGCVAARIEVQGADGVALDVFEGNLVTVSDGGRLTTEAVFFVIGEWPTDVTINATVGGIMTSRPVTIPTGG